ncbi:hypothetical protein [Rhodococcus qingshengii]|uniref:hypothetical protein n=1 Tax=Rhodococcus qingshengii TaxID=334542 RepID=UPI00237C8A38|nr:hypothetical protein [Rhodococcus qingshengii]WCT05846.1 hypothetical protein PI247_30725 [Rhodococcus qingshengii]
MAAHKALSMEGLSDLVLATDEAAAILIRDAAPCSVLTCAFDSRVSPAAVRVILSASTTGEISTSASSFAWHVLESVVDGVVLEQVRPESSGQNWAVTITLNKALQESS